MVVIQILDVLFPSYTFLNRMETDSIYKSEVTATELFSLDTAKISDVLNQVQLPDKLTLTIVFDNDVPVSFYSSSPDIEGFIDKLNKNYHYHQSKEIIDVSITINKKKSQDNINIYDIGAFVSYINTISTLEVFNIFNAALNGSESVNFNVYNLEESFNTQNIFFTPWASGKPQFNIVGRESRTEIIKSISHFGNIENCSLIPEDFNVVNDNEKLSDLSSLFKKYTTLLSIIYLFDITNIIGDDLEFKLNGYKAIKGKVDIKTQLTPEEEYFNIYNWTYSGGNIIDKVGLSRNIISLHFLNTGHLELKGSPFQSIKSGYKVYEKQNIKQYIEIRNKISDQLLDFNNRANKVIETFASGFQKSSLALISFYASTIVLRVLSTGDFQNIFTYTTSILSIAFLICSLLYFLISRWEVRAQRKRFIDSYNNLKERYTDLLDNLDIKRILNNDKEFNADVAFINDKFYKYSWMWAGMILILFLTTVILFMTYNISQLIDTPLWKILFRSQDCSSN